MVITVQPVEYLLPEEWLEQIPPQLLERLAALISFTHDITLEEEAFWEDRCSSEDFSSSEDEDEEAAIATATHADHHDVTALPDQLAGFDIRPQNPGRTSSGQNASVSISFPKAALIPKPPSFPPPPGLVAPRQPPCSPPPELATSPCLHVHRARATWQDVDSGIFKNVTTTTSRRQLPWPWTQAIRPEFRPVENGFWPWNSLSNRPTAFRNRAQGPYPAVLMLQRGKWSSMEDFLAAGGTLGLMPPVRVSDELLVLCEWLAARRAMAERIESIEIVPAMSSEDPPGTWVRASLNKQIMKSSSSGIYNRIGWHGTSMNNLNRIIVHGLQEGWFCIDESTSTQIQGICLMGDGAMDLCCQYALYTPLQNTGYYYAPYLKVRHDYDPTRSFREYVTKYAGRATEYVTYTDVSFVSAIYFHVVAAADMLNGSRDHWINVEVERPANMEIPINAARRPILNHSYYQYQEEKKRGMHSVLDDD